MRITEHLAPGRLEQELAKVEQRRDPPVAVWALRDGVEVAGELHGWAENPRGSNDGWRGLVQGVREYAPGFWAEYLSWVRAEQVRERDG